MKTLSIVAAAVLMTATGALAEEPAATQAAADPEKKICRSEKVTGSLTRVRRICMTQREWDEMAVSNTRALDRMGRNANQAEAMTDRSARGMGGGS